MNKIMTRSRRTNRARIKINGSSARPRMCVNFSNSSIFVQLIDDANGMTLVGTKSSGKGSLASQAQELGARIAELAKKQNITKVSLDRRGKKYHGKLHVFAEAARENGLEF